MLWQELVDFVETFVPGWYDLGMSFIDAVYLALEREKQAIRDLYRQGEELGWRKAL